ncbi:MAG: magnesium/cobalt transporter CorA, partial [Planctomycetes bacterium]|nr:magnesium/cobalt transporter CorA [Planctomycetota bacterium]
VIGFGTERVLERMRAQFQIPWLGLADIVNVPQRPRIEVHREGLLLILQVPRPGAGLDLDQVSFFATGKLVISFREHDDDMFKQPLSRAKDKQSRLRINGPDYLLYRLIDAAVDLYFPHIDRLADQLDVIESDAIEKPSSRPLRDLYHIRRELGILLRAALPSRDVLASCDRECTSYFLPETRPFLRDVQDHLAQIVELAERQRSTAVDIQELVVANLNLRMNQVMKVLTAVTVVFIPLSFVTGVYGMNFVHMPELEWKYGYGMLIALLLGVGLTIYWRLRRAGWFRLNDS